MGRIGKLEDHLKKLHDSTFRWLKSIVVETKQNPNLIQDDFSRMMAYATEDVKNDDESDDDIPMPEPYGVYQQLKRFGMTWWAGGYSDQPYILMLEMSKVEEAIQKFKHDQEIELTAKATISNGPE